MSQMIIDRFLDYLGDQKVRSDQGFRSFEELMKSQFYVELDENLRLQALVHAFGSLTGDLLQRDEIKTSGFVEEFVEQVPIGMARRCEIVAIHVRQLQHIATSTQQPELACIATSSLKGALQLDNLRRTCRMHFFVCFVCSDQVLAWIDEAYEQKKTETDKILSSIVPANNEASPILFDEDLLESDGAAPIIHLVNSTLFDAVHENASDVHFQPYEDRLVVRFRIDGVLFDRITIPKSSQEEVLSRVKVIGRMNIAEKRMPQDGRVSVKVGRRRVDLRIASLPTNHGERIVVRLLDKSTNLYSLAEVGMRDTMLDSFQKVIHREHGMILVTGPTGAGKSTTLYAVLQELNTVEKNVVTLEDPIEYQLEGVSQTQINNRKGLTFATGLRNVLRQDPDIIMVGEIRDEETAEMAIQSSLTGHLVFSTLHTNDAISSVARLLELGVEPYLVANSLVAVLAQRLVRRVCCHCTLKVDPKQLRPERLGPKWYQGYQGFSQGAGCDACRQTGFAGRIGVYELFVMDDPSRDLIQLHKSSADIRDYAVRSGNLVPIKEDGVAKIIDGTTTVDEMARIGADG